MMDESGRVPYQVAHVGATDNVVDSLSHSASHSNRQATSTNRGTVVWTV